MDIERSDIVVSLNGRDEGKRFLVLDTTGQFALLADGRRRRAEKPKLKKHKHVKLVMRGETRVGVCRVSEKIRNGEKVTNSEIRKALADADSAGLFAEKGGM